VIVIVVLVCDERIRSAHGSEVDIKVTVPSIRL
jgi:hypothetical protein